MVDDCCFDFLKKGQDGGIWSIEGGLQPCNLLSGHTPVSLGRPRKDSPQLPRPRSSALPLPSVPNAHTVNCRTALQIAEQLSGHPHPHPPSSRPCVPRPSALWHCASTSLLMLTEARRAARSDRSHLLGGPYFQQMPAMRA